MIAECSQNRIVQAILESSDYEAVDNCLYEHNSHCDDEFDDKNLIE